MGDYDFTQIIQNVFVGNRSLDRFLFLLNNNELSFKIKGGTAYDGSTNQAVFQRKAKHIKHRSKKAYASLSSIAGIILNLLLCTAKIMTGFFSRSVAISADGFNNLSDAGISLMTLLGFQIARYGRGSTHPFGHGRFEWIMGIFASLAVVLMGGKLVQTSFQSIVSPQKPLFSVATIIVLVLSILVKGYMYFLQSAICKNNKL